MIICALHIQSRFIQLSFKISSKLIRFFGEKHSNLFKNNLHSIDIWGNFGKSLNHQLWSNGKSRKRRRFNKIPVTRL